MTAVAATANAGDVTRHWNSGCGSWMYQQVVVTTVVNYSGLDTGGILHVRNSVGRDLVTPQTVAAGSGTISSVTGRLFGPDGNADGSTLPTGDAYEGARTAATSFIEGGATLTVSGGRDLTQFTINASCPQTTIADNAVTLTYTVTGTATCGGTVTVTNVDGDAGGDFAFGGFANGYVFINGTPGAEADYSFGNTSGESRSFAIPSGAGIAAGASITTYLTSGSHEEAAGGSGTGRPMTPRVSTVPSTVVCGGTTQVTITWTSSPSPTPTPTPGVTPTPQPSATAAATAAPSATPVPYPSPGTSYSPPPSSTPFAGATNTNTYVTNASNFYGPVKQAFEDADGAMAAPGNGNSGGGAFGVTNGAHDSGTYGRGNLDDLATTNAAMFTAKTTVVTSIKAKLAAFNDALASMSHQSFGAVAVIPMPFSSIGNAPAVGRLRLPAEINLAPWGDVIDTVRTILLWLLRLGFWVLTLKLFASQGVRAT